MSTWPGSISAITLFTDDLVASREFYERVFALPVFFEDSHSAVFTFGETMINLLVSTEAPDLIAPAAVAPQGDGHRIQFTLSVDDVDVMAQELESRGVQLLNGPMDRPWGIRTASFVDPGGHIWEIAS